jgi:hypothetical protein
VFPFPKAHKGLLLAICMFLPERSTEIVCINQVVLRLIWFIMASQSTYVQG